MIAVHDLSYDYCTGSVLPLFSRLSMHVNKGEFVSLVGASGCGKSTLFRIIAGLLEPGNGEIKMNGKASTRAAERLGRVAFMPQQDLLLPWRTVLENCLLPWELSRTVSKQAACQHIRELLSLFGLADAESAYPHELSGGMRQRAALLRTIAAGKELLLLDEPFGALDAITKREMHCWLLELWGELHKPTVLLITHDLEEALLLSDRIYLMNGGSGSSLQEISVDLPRPRHIRMNYEPQFAAMREDLERRMHDTHIFK